MKHRTSNKINLQSEHGFIALISILILSVVLLGATLSLAQFGLASRYFILDLENKGVSEKLAEACVHTARIMLINNPEYEDTNIVVPVDTKTCTIVSITQDGDESTVTVRGENGNAITNMSVVIDNQNGDFVSWSELPTF